MAAFYSRPGCPYTRDAKTGADPAAGRRPERTEHLIPNIGPMELIIVLVVAVIILGPKRIPEAAKSVGKGIRGFKQTVSGEDDDDKPTLASETTESAKSEEKKKVDS